MYFPPLFIITIQEGNVTIEVTDWNDNLKASLSIYSVLSKWKHWMEEFQYVSTILGGKINVYFSRDLLQCMENEPTLITVLPSIVHR